MSFFGFDNARHNTAAPGFAQAHDPFAGLSGRDGDDDALDFEETYDGLGDQLEETGDAFNDDTFGDSGPAVSRNAGKDFDFFGQTAKVADAIEEEHVRFHRQQPTARPAASAQAPAQVDQYASADYQSYYGGQPYQQQSYQQQAFQQPVRSGYEKYRTHDPEPLPDLHVDRSIWGIGPSKPVQQSSPAPVPAAQPAASRKVMSLEEVEAAMRSQPKQQTPQPHVADLSYQQPPPGFAAPQHQPPQAHGHGHPVTILQRPQSTQSKSTPPVPGLQGTPVQQHQQLHANPTQILQNPSRAGSDAPASQHGHHAKQPHGAVPSAAQLQAHPQMQQMSEEEKAAFLDQETKRAKRNHKIWLLSKDNGLMTPQDKNFITRIQLQQLVSATGNPVEGSDASIAEDFYYQVYSHIRAGQRQNPSQPLSNFAQTYLYQTGKIGRAHV